MDSKIKDIYIYIYIYKQITRMYKINDMIIMQTNLLN